MKVIQKQVSTFLFSLSLSLSLSGCSDLECENTLVADMSSQSEN